MFEKNILKNNKIVTGPLKSKMFDVSTSGFPCSETEMEHTLSARFIKL